MSKTKGEDMAISIDGLSAIELKALRENIDKTIIKRREEDLDALRAEIIELVASRGYSLQEVMARATKSKAPTASYVRGKTYRHPDDPTKTWLCTGSRPQWVRDVLGSGRVMIPA